jgi:hypothetical protein
MKFLRNMTLQGIIDEDEEFLAFDNSLSNVGWFITDIKIMPNVPAAWTQGDLSPGSVNSIPVGLVRLSTAQGQGSQLAWAKDQVVGIGSWQRGAMNQMINTDFLIVDELWLTNLSYSLVAGWDGTMAYQIKLDLYEITDYEQVNAVTKARAQS